MSDQERRIFKGRLLEARFMLHDAYINQREKGIPESDDHLRLIAKWLLENYDDDMPIMYQGWLAGKSSASSK